jgi:hypothetical protein
VLILREEVERLSDVSAPDPSCKISCMAVARQVRQARTVGFQVYPQNLIKPPIKQTRTLNASWVAANTAHCIGHTTLGLGYNPPT